MPPAPSTRRSTHVRVVALGVVAALVLFLAGGLFASTANAAAPTELGSSTTTGLFSLFAIAAVLLGAVAYVLRGARH